MPWHISQVTAAVKAEIDLPSIHTFIDASAHIGCDTALFAELLPKAKVFAIEIDPETFSCLKGNISRLPPQINERIQLLHGDTVSVLPPLLTKEGSTGRVVYFDPPWGDEYKEEKALRLSYGNPVSAAVSSHGNPVSPAVSSRSSMDVAEWSVSLLKDRKCSHIILKAPRNFDIDNLTTLLGMDYYYRQHSVMKSGEEVAFYLLFMGLLPEESSQICVRSRVGQLPLSVDAKDFSSPRRSTPVSPRIVSAAATSVPSVSPYTPTPAPYPTPTPTPSVSPYIPAPYPTPTPVSPYIPTPVSPYIPTPVSPYIPTPVSPYIPTPVSPYIPTPVSPYIPTPVSPSVTPYSPGPSPYIPVSYPSSYAPYSSYTPGPSPVSPYTPAVSYPSSYAPYSSYTPVSPYTPGPSVSPYTPTPVPYPSSAPSPYTPGPSVSPYTPYPSPAPSPYTPYPSPTPSPYPSPTPSPYPSPTPSPYTPYSRK